jgi:hypothetical protein
VGLVEGEEVVLHVWGTVQFEVEGPVLVVLRQERRRLIEGVQARDFPALVGFDSLGGSGWVLKGQVIFVEWRRVSFANPWRRNIVLIHVVVGGLGAKRGLGYPRSGPVIVGRMRAWVLFALTLGLLGGGGGVNHFLGCERIDFMSRIPTWNLVELVRYSFMRWERRETQSGVLVVNLTTLFSDSQSYE